MGALFKLAGLGIAAYVGVNLLRNYRRTGEAHEH